jgi:NTE family protein
MALGRDDAMRQRAEICQFFGWTDPTMLLPQIQPPTEPVIERRRDPLRLR